MSRATLDFDSLASAYDAWFGEEGKLIFVIEVKAFQEVLPVLPRSWLEVGVGSGRFAQALGIETGIDPSAKLLAMARRRGITGFLARGEEPLFDEETFGTAFLIVTLCFIGSPLAVLREARRILKAGGKTALGLVLRDSPWGRFYLAKKAEGHRFYKHATFYSYDEVVKLLGKAGFTIEMVISTLFQKPGKVEEMEAPREILKAIPGIELVEMERNRGDSFCCGGGSGNFYTDFFGGGENSASRIRVREAYEINADILAVACPICAMMLNDAIKGEGLEEKLIVKDISEIVKESLSSS